LTKTIDDLRRQMTILEKKNAFIMDALQDRDKKIEELESHVNIHNNKLKEQESMDQTISRHESEIVDLI
jgi:predicted  nucleic acid-binding Zn-ribbon protein